jgi:IS5 family transposase
MIGHMKNDRLLYRNWLKETLGDALHAVLCGAGHNLRMILKKLRLLFAWIMGRLLKATLGQNLENNGPDKTGFAEFGFIQG